MKNNNEFAVVLGVLLAIVIGGIIGYACAVYGLHREAIANRAGHWEIVADRVEFAWGTPQDCDGQ